MITSHRQSTPADKAAFLTLGKFGRRLVLAVIAVISLTVVVLGTLSYLKLRETALQVAYTALQGESNALAGDLRSRLNLLKSNAQMLARNSLVVNALVDNYGRDIYLGRFFEDLKEAEGFSVAIQMTDFQGQQLAANQVDFPITIPTELIIDVIDSGDSTIHILTYESQPYFVAIEPIIYSSTGTVEGALIYKIGLSQWLKFEQIQTSINSNEWISSLSLEWDDTSEEIYRLVEGNRFTDDLSASASVSIPNTSQRLNFTLYAKKDIIDIPLRELLFTTAASGTTALIIAVFLIIFIVKRLTRRLVRLRHETDQLTNIQDDDVLFSLEGNDEVSDLAQSFSHLVDDLRSAYDALEQSSTKSLKESESRFRSIVEHSADGILVLSDKSIIEMANPAIGTIFGYDSDRLISQSIELLLTKNSLSTLTSYLDAYVATDRDTETNSQDIYGKRACGQVFDLGIKVSSIEADGETHFVLMVNDISKEKYAAEQMQQAKEEAERANQAKSQFLSAMSHELRTPLNAIIGFAQLIDAPDNPLNDEQKEGLSHITNGGEHLLSLINEILELAKIESGSFDLTLETVPVDSILGTPLVMAKSLAKKHGITISRAVDDSAKLAVHADAKRARQVLINLLSNAVKYNRQGGTVTVRVDAVDGGAIRFQVTDTGPGLSANDQQRLFVPFERLNQTDGSIEGTGIGLTITKELVESMSGQVGVQSELGEGSTFWFELPTGNSKEIKIESTKPKEKRDDSTDSTTQSAPVRIVYIEDNRVNQELLKAIVKKYPHLSLETSETAEAGLKLITRTRPDLILMDINLPGISGIEATQILKKTPELAHIPVIAVSANTMKHDIEQASQAGFYAYLSKPFKAADLLDSITEALENAS